VPCCVWDPSKSDVVPCRVACRVTWATLIFSDEIDDLSCPWIAAPRSSTHDIHVHASLPNHSVLSACPFVSLLYLFPFGLHTALAALQFAAYKWMCVCGAWQLCLQSAGHGFVCFCHAQACFLVSFCVHCPRHFLSAVCACPGLCEA
jgi:hypothetical protein